MDRVYRPLFNAHTSDALFQTLTDELHGRVGPVPFRVAETPFFLTERLRARLVDSATAIVRELSEPAALAAMKRAVPAHYDVPNAPALPECVQVDFAITEGDWETGFTGGLDVRVVELQAFPSLYAFEAELAQAWSRTLGPIPELCGDWKCFFEGTFDENLERIRRTLLAGEDPEHVVLVDIEPGKQKTLPDFVATQKLFGVEAVCITKLKKRGNRLFREKNGREVPVRRIYNRVVFDELEAKKVTAPFDWRDDLDLTWCSHPNWYWIWSKVSLPYLSHETVPKTRFLSDPEIAHIGDLENYVLKPLHSFAGSGVVIDVTPDDIARIPEAQRDGWILQRKVTYAPAIEAPSGPGVKAEVRVMLLRDPNGTELRPLLPLVRLSRGKLLGVDHNRGMTWVGASVGLWK